METQKGEATALATMVLQDALPDNQLVSRLATQAPFIELAELHIDQARGRAIDDHRRLTIQRQCAELLHRCYFCSMTAVRTLKQICQLMVQVALTILAPPRAVSDAA